MSRVLKFYLPFYRSFLRSPVAVTLPSTTTPMSTTTTEFALFDSYFDDQSFDQRLVPYQWSTPPALLSITSVAHAYDR